jgi:ribosomal protein S18 acetylase RimI-like enzyme
MFDAENADEQRPQLPGVRFREGTGADAGAIAVLHADSWRRHYRGAFLNSYLDGDVVADRVAEWSHRLAPPRLNQYTVVAEQDGEIIGFAHVVFDHDPRWGALLDNLHVTSGLKRLGIGTTLLSEAAQVLVEQRPSDALYLWVLEQNKAAQAFYASRGGTCVGSDLRGPFPGGGRATGYRYAWPDPSELIARDR